MNDLEIVEFEFDFRVYTIMLGEGKTYEAAVAQARKEVQEEREWEKEVANT